MNTPASDWARTVRFIRGWVTSRWNVEQVEIQVDRGDDSVPATLFLPAGHKGALPGWVVLHGITRPGRAHPSLLRFARSLASTPAAVLVPEIPEWRELRLAPETAVPTIKASILALDRHPETSPGRTGVVGFSFGSPMAIAASTDEDLSGHVGAVVGFGGYYDLERAMRFQFSGRHEWEGREEYLDPDPYGRWIVAANYLPEVPGYEGAEDVAEALRALARDAGDRRIMAANPIFDPLKASLRSRVSAPRRELFDLFAPASDRGVVDASAGVAMGVALAAAARRSAPGLDPAPFLPAVRVPVRLVHGREDQLIPYSETLRLEKAFPEESDVSAFVTGLFAHAQGGTGPSLLRFGGECVRFVVGLRRTINAL